MIFNTTVKTSCCFEKQRRQITLHLFEKYRDALTTADAGRPDGESRKEGGVVGDVANDPGARGPEGVAQGNCPTMRIKALVVDAERLLDRQALRSKSLVDLEELDVVEGDACGRNERLDGGNRPDAHF